MELGKNVLWFMIAGAFVMAALGIAIGHPCISVLVVAWIVSIFGVEALVR